MPRIALITTSYPAFRGDPSGHFVETEARALARDAEIVVITAATEPSSRGHCLHGGATEEDGVLVWRLDGGGAFGWPGVPSRVRERPARLAGVARWAREAHGVLARLRPLDRVVAHWAVPSAFPVARARGTARLEIVSHGADVRALQRLPAPLRDALVSTLLRDASRWRFVSRSLEDALAAALRPRDARRLRALAYVSPASIDLPDVHGRSRELRVAASGDGRGLRVLVGRLVAEKRFDRALDAVAQTCPDSRVVVVGDGPERGRLEAHARALGVDARFVGKTPRGEALAWIGAADALVHASRTEGLSTVVREAEALGVRVEIVP